MADLGDSSDTVRHGFKREIEAMRPDVVFTVIFRRDGEFLAAPTVLGEFGRELCVEIPELMRSQVLAMAPNQEGRSFTSAKMAIFLDDAWQPAKKCRWKRSSR
jgi:hypothetical protein